MEEYEVINTSTSKQQIEQKQFPSEERLLEAFETNKTKVKFELDHFNVEEEGKKWRVFNANSMEEQGKKSFPELKELTRHELIDAMFRIGCLRVSYDKLSEKYYDSEMGEELPRNIYLPFLLPDNFYSAQVYHMRYGVFATFHIGEYGSIKKETPATL